MFSGKHVHPISWRWDGQVDWCGLIQPSRDSLQSPFARQGIILMPTVTGRHHPMKLIFVAAASATLCLPSLARADFVIGGASGPASVDAVPGQPIRLNPEAQAAPIPRPLPPRLRAATGFGDQVPLAFAVKQIVPRTIAVSYGPGASSESLVTWRGGAPWNQVLQAAVRPLGLHVVLAPGAVRIRK